MKKRKKDFRGQRGIALLFALGMLSLLLILGLAFVTNALVAQKVAQNNSSRSQAKMLAQSADQPDDGQPDVLQLCAGE